MKLRYIFVHQLCFCTWTECRSLSSSHQVVLPGDAELHTFLSHCCKGRSPLPPNLNAFLEIFHNKWGGGGGSLSIQNIFFCNIGFKNVRGQGMRGNRPLENTPGVSILCYFHPTTILLLRNSSSSLLHKKAGLYFYNAFNNFQLNFIVQIPPGWWRVTENMAS